MMVLRAVILVACWTAVSIYAESDGSTREQWDPASATANSSADPVSASSGGSTSELPSPSPENVPPGESPALQSEGSSEQSTVAVESPPAEDGAPAKATSNPLRDRLKVNPNELGESAGLLAVALINPMDFTGRDFSDIARTSIIKSLDRFGEIPLTILDDTLSSLTINDFRTIVLKNKVDLVIVATLKPTSIDLFLFDKRTPYEIYAHSEPLPEEIQYQLNKEAVEEYTNIAFRRVLYAFVKKQSFELPRQETASVLSSEIPRWIASVQSYETVNRENLSRCYGSASVGAALAVGGGKFWNSNLLGLQIGFRVYSRYYVELHADLYSYNAVGVSIKYLSNNIDSPLRFSFGVGAAQSINKFTLNYDQNHTQGIGGNYIVPSAAVMFPVVDLHFKVESKVFVGLGDGRMVLAVMPGLFFLF